MRKAGKLRLSPTRIATFLACRMMYRYEYVDKIGRFYHKATAGNAFGATLHQSLQQFHEAGGAESESPDDLVARGESLWRTRGYASSEDEAAHRSLAADILRRYHEAEAQRDEVRRLFLTEKQFSLDMGLFVLTGRVDRIDEHVADGGLEIVDYKTRDDVTEDDVRNALAMTIYQLLVKRTYPDRRVVGTVYALRGGVSASIELTGDELDAWEDELRGVGRQIVETDFESVRPAYLVNVCGDCDFYRICKSYFHENATLDC